MKRVLYLFLLICFALGALTGCKNETEKESALITAEVMAVNGVMLTVRGLSEGYGSEYRLNTDGAFVCREGEEEISAEIEVGDKISITFSGIALKDNPGTLMNVTKIVKLKV